MKKKPMDLARVKKEIKRLDPGLSEESDDFKTATLLISSLIVGPNIPRLEKFTGISRKFISPRASNLRKNGVWTHDGKVSVEWFEKSSGVAFWCDVAVAEGWLNRITYRESLKKKPNVRRKT